MNEYISREELIDKLKMWLAELEADKNKGYSDELYENKGAREAVECCIAEIETLPAANVQPVKRGEWEKKSSVGVFRCSLCQHIFMLGADEIDEYHFCPNCGARMDGDAE